MADFTTRFLSSILAGGVAFTVFSPLSYKFTDGFFKFFNKTEMAKDGCPTLLGLSFHSFLYMIMTFMLMSYGAKSVKAIDAKL